MRLGELLRARGNGCTFGGLIVTISSTTSTNDVALQLARRGAPEGTLVLADEQTAGRGRFRRVWLSPPESGLYLSVLLRPRAGVGHHPGLVPILASVAAAEALREVSGSRVVIRWPNDLYLEERKIGGILCEGSFSGDAADFVVVGLGVNVNQETFLGTDVAERATSLRMATGRAHDRSLVAAAIVESLERWWSVLASSPNEIVGRWRELAEGHEGARVVIQNQNESFEGLTAGINEEGGLLLEDPKGRRRVFYSGDVVKMQVLR